MTFGFSTAAPSSVQLTSAQFPAGSAPRISPTPTRWRRWLGGTVSSVAQTFQVQDKTLGLRRRAFRRTSSTRSTTSRLFLQDNWRWKPNFTVRGGLKWEYYSPLREDNDLGFLPVLNGRAFEQAMLDPATTVTLRQRRLLQEGPEQLRADRRLRLGPDQGRQDRGSRRLLADASSTRTRSPSAALGFARQRRSEHAPSR